MGAHAPSGAKLDANALLPMRAGVDAHVAFSAILMLVGWAGVYPAKAQSKAPRKRLRGAVLTQFAFSPRYGRVVGPSGSSAGNVVGCVVGTTFSSVVRSSFSLP